MRLDNFLVEQGLYATRSRARDAILRGAVTVDGETVRKPAAGISDSPAVHVDDEAHGYVSRAALKLRHGLGTTGFDATGTVALDIGASTGGFTQVLLETGAAHVFAIDAGHGQMVPELASDPRVTNLERVNARSVDAALFGDTKIGFVVADVSFISLKLALPPALKLAQAGSSGIFLIKPQFEVGRQQIGKGGLVRSAAIAEASATSLADWLDEQPGWRRTHFLPSPISGGDGNREWLMAGVKDG